MPHEPRLVLLVVLNEALQKVVPVKYHHGPGKYFVTFGVFNSLSNVLQHTVLVVSLAPPLALLTRKKI